MKATILFAIVMATLLTQSFTFAQDTTVTVTSSGNVGIGTANPAHKLDVNGAINGTSFLLNGFPLSTGGTSQWTPSGNNIYNNNTGNVGIGTTSPNRKLVVIADGHGISHQSSTYGTDVTTYCNASGGWIGTFSNVPLNFYTNNGGIQMALSTAGNFGIATSAPATRLHVVADAANAGVARFDNTNTAGFSGIYVDQASTPRGWFGYVNSGSSFAAPGTTQLGSLSDLVFSVNPGQFFNERMRITTAGNVGIGTSAPTTLLHVNGSARNNTGVWTTTSDRRLKKDIESIENALETVRQLQGVTFRWKDEKKDEEYGRVRGMIAQDVEKVIPEWVKTDADGHKRIEPIGEFAILIEAIKAQQKQIEELKAQVKSLAAQKNGVGNESMGELK